jgi:hypothetical protein
VREARRLRAVWCPLILAEVAPTGAWTAIEVLLVGLLLVANTLWRRAQTRSASPEVVSRYRKSTLACAFWVALVAVSLLTHAY